MSRGRPRQNFFSIMQHYELLSVLPGTLSEQEVGPAVEQVQTLITANGGSNVVVRDMGKSRLAYPMKHIRYGYFHLFLFEAEPDKVPDIKEKLRLSGGLLRILINIYNPAKRENKGFNIEQAQLERAQGYRGGTERTESRETMPEREEVPAPKAPVQEKPKEERGKVDMEELDKKLDEILDTTLTA